MINIEHLIDVINTDLAIQSGQKLNVPAETIVKRIAESVNQSLYEIEEKTKLHARNAVISHEEEFLIGDCD